jgi:hypothetical protein
MEKINSQLGKDRNFLYFTVPVVILMAICSAIGIWQQNLYFRETTDWLAQCVGQDISNLFFVAPILLLSALYATRGNKVAKIIWIGAMITNIYSYVIYCFAVHFNYLFLVYCIILGLSNFSVIYFFVNYLKEDFKSWFTEKVPTKTIGIFLIFISIMFAFLWLSGDLPAVLKNNVPENIIETGLITNTVHVLDYTFYLPLIFIAGFMLIKKKNLGYLLAPMTIVFAIITNVNIISLMVVAKYKNVPSDTGLIIGFGIFTVIYCLFLWSMLRRLKKQTKNKI